jgi:hypothetical protein
MHDYLCIVAFPCICKYMYVEGEIKKYIDVRKEYVSEVK